MEVLEIICDCFFFILLLLIFIVFPLMIAKINVAHRQRIRIINAIYSYQLETVFYDVSYRDMEPFDKTCKRFWDWGYTRILPKEKFEIIKPYITKEKKK